MRLGKALLAAAIAAPTLVIGAPAVAAPGEGALKAATIDVSPASDGSSTSVRTQVELSGVSSGADVTSSLPSLDGVDVSSLQLSVDGRSITPERQDSSGLTRLRFPAPSDGSLRYEAEYSVTGAESARVPLLVPEYASTGERTVTFRYHVPDGYYLQSDALPSAAGSTGTLTQKLSGVPTVIDYDIGQSPPSALNAGNVGAGGVIALIAVVSVLVFLREARQSARGVAHV